MIQAPLRTEHPELPMDSNGNQPLQRKEESRSFFGSLPLSILAGITLLGSLIYLAGPWALLANTRLLNLLIDAGIIKYHDRHAGIIEGVADHIYYFKAQDPIAWTVLAIVVALYLLIAVLKAVQFDVIARAYGMVGSLGDHTRAFLYGLIYKETTPFQIGDAATAAAMSVQGAPLARTRAAIFALNAFFFFEVAVFALFGLLSIGWAAWLFQLFCALAIITTLYLWTRPSRSERKSAEGSVGIFNALKTHSAALAHQPVQLLYLCLLSIVSFGLRDLAAYFTAMAFSTQNVLLNIDPSLILMGVLGGYIASFIRVTPGGIGQFEWGFATALFIGGVGLPEAATVAILVNFFRYVALFVLFLVTTLWHKAQTSFSAVVALMNSVDWQTPLSSIPGHSGSIGALMVPAWRLPSPATLWLRGLVLAWIILAVLLFDRLTLLLSDLWLLQSVGLGSVFMTNFRMSALLFGGSLIAYGVALSLPAYTQGLGAGVRRRVLSFSLLIGVMAGALLAGRYQDLLPLFNHVHVGEADPIFGRDISFYLFMLPGLWTLWIAALVLALATLISSITCSALSVPIHQRVSSGNRLLDWIALISTPTTRLVLALNGIVIAAGLWLSRYELLFKENYEASVFTGAAFIDINGIFSTLGQIYVTLAVVLGVSLLLFLLLRRLSTASEQGWKEGWMPAARQLGLACAALIALDFAFTAGVAVRQLVAVGPNQPVIQLPYIARHIEATRKAYGIDRVEEVDLLPTSADAPLPSLDRLLASPALRNAPLWPTSVSYLEQLVDPQHAQRILQTGGEKMVYGPTLENFRQQQQLRTYYDFLSVSPQRFVIDGEPRIFATSVRELPILEPQPWLAWWGQRFMLFTHGHGLVMSPVGEIAPGGGPVFVSESIPARTAYPELNVTTPEIYYGAGSGSMAVSNVRDMQEFDYPTEHGRAENVLAADVPAGVPIDSWLKRLIFGWRSGEFAQILFSHLITPETRLHYERQPMQRLARIAPFLFIDNNPYPALVDGEILWLINALTTSDRYPYSKHEYLGDKSISRSPQAIETRRINYVEDSVKATVHATTGQVRLYKIANSPVIDTWAQIYPNLFADGAQMPDGVRAQLTYPIHLFHIQFDDVYIYYHMNDPMYFFNMEDIWDDADEVLGPLLDQGKAITFSLEPTHLLMETGGLLPSSSTRTQFVLMMAFTPEGARNLRAVPLAYQDGDDYGRLIVLQVPKGEYIMGPEQADAVIDQDPDISEKISWWNRMGTEVIRGHTTMMIIDNEIIYIEPLFIRSQQNSITQLKRVMVVVRGQAYMAENIEDAMNFALQDLSDAALVYSSQLK